MNCRERTLAALNHEEVDRVPLDFGGRHTTLHLHAHEALMRHLGLTGPKPRIRMQATRTHNVLAPGVSPRGSLALTRASQALALTDGRLYCIP